LERQRTSRARARSRHSGRDEPPVSAQKTVPVSGPAGQHASPVSAWEEGRRCRPGRAIRGMSCSTIRTARCVARRLAFSAGLAGNRARFVWRRSVGAGTWRPSPRWSVPRFRTASLSGPRTEAWWRGRRPFSMRCVAAVVGGGVSRTSFASCLDSCATSSTMPSRSRVCGSFGGTGASRHTGALADWAIESAARDPPSSRPVFASEVSVATPG
jgi:hypothetical protein